MPREPLPSPHAGIVRAQRVLPVPNMFSSTTPQHLESPNFPLPNRPFTSPGVPPAVLREGPLANRAGQAAHHRAALISRQVELFIQNELAALHDNNYTPVRLGIFRSAFAMLIEQLPTFSPVLTRIMREFDAFIITHCVPGREPPASTTVTPLRSENKPKLGLFSKLKQDHENGTDEDQELQQGRSVAPIRSKVLQVTVKEASEVMSGTTSFVHRSLAVGLRIGAIEYRTSVKDATVRSPVWNENFIFTFDQAKGTDIELEIKVFSHNPVDGLVPIATSAIQISKAQMDAWASRKPAAMGIPVGTEDDWLGWKSNHSMWVPLHERNHLEPFASVLLDFRNLTDQADVALSSVLRSADPKTPQKQEGVKPQKRVIYTLCQGCVQSSKPQQESEVKLDPAKQNMLREKNRELQSTVTELKDYVQVFLKEIEVKTIIIERMEAKLARLEAAQKLSEKSGATSASTTTTLTSSAREHRSADSVPASTSETPTPSPPPLMPSVVLPAIPSKSTANEGEGSGRSQPSVNHSSEARLPQEQKSSPVLGHIPGASSAPLPSIDISFPSARGGEDEGSGPGD